MKAIFLLFLFFSISNLFSQEERVYFKGTNYSIYNHQIDLKNKLPEDKVFFNLEMEMIQHLSIEQIATIEQLMKKDDANSFVVMDANSNKVSYYTTKVVLRQLTMLEYCKKIMELSKCNIGYKNTTNTILEIVID